MSKQADLTRPKTGAAGLQPGQPKANSLKLGGSSKPGTGGGAKPAITRATTNQPPQPSHAGNTLKMPSAKNISLTGEDAGSSTAPSTRRVQQLRSIFEPTEGVKQQTCRAERAPTVAATQGNSASISHQKVSAGPQDTSPAALRNVQTPGSAPCEAAGMSDLRHGEAAYCTAANKENMQVFVKTINGTTKTMHVPKNVTVTEFQQLLEDKVGIPPNQQRLLYAGHEIRDDLPGVTNRGNTTEPVPALGRSDRANGNVGDGVAGGGGSGGPHGGNAGGPSIGGGAAGNGDITGNLGANGNTPNTGAAAGRGGATGNPGANGNTPNTGGAAGRGGTTGNPGANGNTPNTGGAAGHGGARSKIPKTGTGSGPRADGQGRCGSGMGQATNSSRGGSQGSSLGAGGGGGTSGGGVRLADFGVHNDCTIYQTARLRGGIHVAVM